MRPIVGKVESRNERIHGEHDRDQDAQGQEQQDQGQGTIQQGGRVGPSQAGVKDGPPRQPGVERRATIRSAPRMATSN